MIENGEPDTTVCEIDSAMVYCMYEQDIPLKGQLQHPHNFSKHHLKDVYFDTFPPPGRYDSLTDHYVLLHTNNFSCNIHFLKSCT